MTETTLTWTPANWVTVLLMVAVGGVILSGLGQLWVRVKPQSQNA